MKLSQDEEVFLHHWTFDEMHYQDGPGPAKQLQFRHRVVPADLACLIATAIPNLADQEAAGSGPPLVETPHWPWSEEERCARLVEAREMLAARRKEEMAMAK